MNCQDNCIRSTKWYQFQARRACLAGCADLSAQQAYQMQAQTILQQEENSGKILRIVVPGMILIVVLLIVARYKGWI